MAHSRARKETHTMLTHSAQRSKSIALSAITPFLLAFAPQDPSFNPPSLDLTLGNGEVQSYVIEVCIPGETNVSMADVFLLADSTGSMGDEIAQVQADAGLILGTLLGDPNIDFQIGVGDYKDFSDSGSFVGGGGGSPDPYAFQLAQSITDNAVDINTAIDAWDADGGNDIPEGQLFAFDRLVNDPGIGWRAGAKRIIIFFGDAPGHDPVCAAISGNAYDITEASVIADLQGAGPGGTTIIGVSSDGGLNDNFDSGDYTGACGYSESGNGQADRIAAGTGGLVEEIGNPAEVTTAILDAIVTVLSEVDVSLNPTGGIAGLVTSIDPPSHSIVLPEDPTEEICVLFTVNFEGYCVSDPADADPSASLDLHLDGAPTSFGIPTDAHLDVCDDDGDDILTESIFAGLDVDIQTSQVWGSIAAGNDLNVETCNLGIGVTDEDTDTMIAQHDLNAHIGNLEHGNIVAGNSLNIAPTFGIAGGTLAPRIDNVVDWANILNIVTTTTTTVGALAPTGTVTVQQDNLILSAHTGADVEIFLVTAAQLEYARDVSIDVDAGSAAIVNIEGGNLNPMQFGIRLVNIGPDMVLFNAFEASQVSIADVNFDGSLVVQGGDMSIAEIDVAGQLISGGNISLQTTRVYGQIFNGEIGELVPFMAGHPVQEPMDSLLHNLLLSPSSSGGVTVASMGSAEGSPLAVTVNGQTRSFRADKVASLTVANVTDHTLVDVDPSLGLEVHLLELQPLGGQDVFMLDQFDVPETGRGMITMDLFSNDLAGSSGLDIGSFQVVKRPAHAFASFDPASASVRYLWDASKWSSDSFEYTVLDGNGVRSAPIEVRILR
jgi:choice-of-anchor A domain-containing protein